MLGGSSLSAPKKDSEATESDLPFLSYSNYSI
jgi:hypothetical protein